MTENMAVSIFFRNFALVNWKRAPLCERQALLTSGEDALHVAPNLYIMGAYRLDVEYGNFYKCA